MICGAADFSKHDEALLTDKSPEPSPPTLGLIL